MNSFLVLLYFLVILSNLIIHTTTATAAASTKIPASSFGVVVDHPMQRQQEQLEHNNNNNNIDDYDCEDDDEMTSPSSKLLPHWTDLSYHPGSMMTTMMTTTTMLKDGEITKVPSSITSSSTTTTTTFQEPPPPPSLMAVPAAARWTTNTISNSSSKNDNANIEQQQQQPLRLALFVEPCPVTYVSGVTARFQELLRHLEQQQTTTSLSSSQSLLSLSLSSSSSSGSVAVVEIVTAENMISKANRPTTAFGFPIRYTKGILLPFYPICTISWDITLETFRSVYRIKPNLIHASSPGSMPLKGILLAKLFSIPLLLSYHTHLPVYVKTYIRPQWLSKVATRFTWVILGWVHRMADITVVTSPQIQAEFHAHNIPRVELWDKGIDTQRFHPCHKNLTMRHRMTKGHPHDFVLVYVGRLACEKRCEDLKQVLEQLPGSRLCLVGKGPHQDILQKQFDGLPVHFMGELYGEELSQTFASADVFVFPSDSETLGFVVMEAMASCLPVVAANGGGVPNMVRHGETGYLIEPGDTKEYVRVLKLLQSNPTLREQLGQQGRHDAQLWSWEESMSRFTKVTYQLAQDHYNRRWNVRLWRTLFGSR